MNKSDILKFVRHVYKRGQGIPDRRLIHPRREWLIGVAVFMIITSLGAVWSVHTFQTYSTLDRRTYQVPQTVPDYNAKLVNTVLEELSKRQADYDGTVGILPEKPPEIEMVASSTLDVASSTLELPESPSDIASSTAE